MTVSKELLQQFVLQDEEEVGVPPETEEDKDGNEDESNEEDDTQEDGDDWSPEEE
tara:strand:- start:1829 stop:1993 length:165 start_codon:yes stop_codon:yes gene_type:complete